MLMLTTQPLSLLILIYHGDTDHTASQLNYLVLSTDAGHIASQLICFYSNAVDVHSAFQHINVNYPAGAVHTASQLINIQLLCWCCPHSLSVFKLWTIMLMLTTPPLSLLILIYHGDTDHTASQLNYFDLSTDAGHITSKYLNYELSCCWCPHSLSAY